MQKKTFTKWVNSHLARVSCRITDLYMDLRDGRMLIKLLEVLSGEKLVSLIPSAPTPYDLILLKHDMLALIPQSQLYLNLSSRARAEQSGFDLVAICSAFDSHLIVQS